ESFSFAFKLATAFSFPMVMKTEIELDLLDIIAKADPGSSLSASKLVAQVPKVNNPEASVVLDRISILLASHKVLTCTLKETHNDGLERFYGLALVCKFLTKNKGGVSLAPLLLLDRDKIMYYLKEVVMDGGIPFNKAYGMSPFEYQGKDQILNKLFNGGMFVLGYIAPAHTA
ncbi:caffeic acid 3-O-methyltransferase, partial [Tanacetum coccineum]